MMHRQSRFIASSLTFFFLLFLLFIYLPLMVLVGFSFNDSAFAYVWNGFSFRWYYQLARAPEIWNALGNSLLVAACAVFLSIVMATVAAFYGLGTLLERSSFFFYIMLAAPEVIIAVSLLYFFILCNVPLGITTLVIAHTLVGLSYAVPIISTRLSEIDRGIIQASLDLGASRFQTFRYIVLPIVFPVLLATALLLFAVSFDDFIISFFCSGATTQTLPMYIFSMIRSGSTPILNALSVCLLLTSITLIVLFSSLNGKKIDLFTEY